MNIQDEIIGAIECMASRIAGSMTIPQTVASIVQNIKGDTYQVSINGNTVFVKNGTDMTFAVGAPVWVHIPSDISTAFIMAKR